MSKIKEYKVELNLEEQKELRSQITDLFKADSIKIQDNPAYEMIGSVLVLAKGKAKEISNFYLEPKSFAHNIHKEICQMEKDDLDVLKTFETVAKTAMSNYLLEQEEKVKELENSEEVTDIVKEDYEAPEVKGVSVSDVYSFEIEDESLIPREYLIPNEKMIKDMVKASNGSVEIPGVKVTKNKTISVRS